MKITITTFHAPEAPEKTWGFAKERKCDSLAEGLKVWMDAMLDTTIDRIRVEVTK